MMREPSLLERVKNHGNSWLTSTKTQVSTERKIPSRAGVSGNRCKPSPDKQDDKNSHIWYLVPAITAFPLKPIVEWRPLSRFLSKLSNSHITLKVNVFSRGGGSFLCYIHDSFFFFFKSRYDYILGRNFTLWRTMFIVDVYNRPRTCNIKKWI